MAKIVMGPHILISPMQTLLVGANVNDKPNFMAVTWGAVASHQPPMISVAIRHQRYTLRGIRQNMTFSVNVPSTDILRETDYCGITSGDIVDKVEVCRFKVFYGELNNAPLIEQCPINLECKVVHILDLGSHSLVIGMVEETHVSEDCLTDGKPDINKIKPFMFTPIPTAQYRVLSNDIAKIGSIGKALKTKQ